MEGDNLYSKTKAQKDMEILNLQECADLLRIHPHTVQRYMKLGLPYIQVVARGRVTFDKEKVLKWMSKFNHPYEKFLRRRR